MSLISGNPPSIAEEPVAGEGRGGKLYILMHTRRHRTPAPVCTCHSKLVSLVCRVVSSQSAFAAAATPSRTRENRVQANEFNNVATLNARDLILRAVRVYC